MKKINIILIVLYCLVLISFCFYSYALIDPNITLFNHPLWSRFLETMLQLGYYQRSLSWQIYFVLVCLLFIFNYIFIYHYKNFNPLKIAALTALLLLFSYPFLSHDFLKYMFDAKIVTVYHKNPYLFRPMDFSNDPWLRFLHWIEQPFRYGPIFLIIILIPSFLAVGKFFLSFIFFKITFAIFYLLAVYHLNRWNRRWALVFATHPLILIDGLINSHNDIIGVSLMIIGFYWLIMRRKSLLARLLLILSVGIKYLTLPTLFVSSKPKSMINKIIFSSLLILSILMIIPFVGNIFWSEIQTWYFIVLLGFLPFFEIMIRRLNLLFLGLLLAYYPFIKLGGWKSFYGFPIKHLIIFVFVSLNLVYLLYIFLKNKSLAVKPN